MRLFINFFVLIIASVHALGINAMDHNKSVKDLKEEVETAMLLMRDLKFPDCSREDLIDESILEDPIVLSPTQRLSVLTKTNELICMSIEEAYEQREHIQRASWVYSENGDFVHLKPNEIQSTKNLPQYELINKSGRLFTYRLSNEQTLRDAMKLKAHPVVISLSCTCRNF